MEGTIRGLGVEIDTGSAMAENATISGLVGWADQLTAGLLDVENAWAAFVGPRDLTPQSTTKPDGRAHDIDRLRDVQGVMTYGIDRLARLAEEIRRRT